MLPATPWAARGIDQRTLQAFMAHRSIANKVVYTAVAEPPKDLGQVSANVVSTPARHCDQRPLALDAERPSGVRHRRCDCVCTDRSVQRWSDCSGSASSVAARPRPRHEHLESHSCVLAETASHMPAEPASALRGSGCSQNATYSKMPWPKWVVPIAGFTGSALSAVRPPKRHITPDCQRELQRRNCTSAGFAPLVQCHRLSRTTRVHEPNNEFPRLLLKGDKQGNQKEGTMCMRKAILGGASALALASPVAAADLPVTPS